VGTPGPLLWTVLRHWLVEHWGRCGWVGTAYEVRVIGREAAVRAAEREAVAHEDCEREK
jgi:hypothetical protein